MILKIKFLTLLLLDTFMYWTDLTKTIVEIMYKTGKMLVAVLCCFRYVLLNFTGLYTLLLNVTMASMGICCGF